MLRLKRIWEGDKPKLSHYLNEMKPKKVGLCWGHGLGDEILFLNVFDKLASLYPDIEFTLILQKGLGFEELDPDIVGGNKKVIYSSDLSYNEETSEYDIIADIDFPMSEGRIDITKAENCCISEIGIDPVCGHKKLTTGKNRLIAISYHITCLPDAANPDEATAKMIWDDVLSEGFIPLEMYFTHVFSNPVNKMFPFIDCTVRRVKPQVSTLIGLIESCAGVISVVTGNLHVSLSILPDNKIFFLQKHFKLESFTKRTGIAWASIMPGEYKNEVKSWLQTL